MSAGRAAAQEPTPNPPAPTLPSSPDPSAPQDAPVVAVTGRVIDVLGKPVGGATVRVETTGETTTTDRDGKFRLSAAIGASLIVERGGFDPALANVTAGRLDDVVMLKAGSNAETIEVSGEAPPASPGAAALDRKELQRIPGTGNDIVRSLTAMPGVVNMQIPLGYSGVVIRGSSPQDSKVLIDGFEVPVLFHNIGFRALVPAEAIQSLDYIPGGFDVQYGRASSGIVALETRPGSDKRTAQAEVSLIDGGLLAQGTAGAKTRYMMGLRRSTIDLVLPSLIPADADLSLTTVPSYYDGQLRIDHDLSARWQLFLSAIGTNDVFELYATKDENAKTKRFYNNTRFVRTTVGANYHEGPWSAKLALSGLWQEFIFEIGALQRIRVQQPAVTPRVEITRTADSWIGLSKVVWRVGGEAQIGRSSIDLALPLEQREGEPPPAYDPKDTSTTFKGSFWVPDFAGWTALTADIDPRIRATIGMRTDIFSRIGEANVEPRGELQVKLPGSLTARLSAGAYRRPPEFQSENLYTNVGSEHSTQTIAGLQYEPREGMRVQASAYYTDRSHLITHGMDGSLNNDGRGTTTGAELLATYRGGPWFTWLSYSYSHSTRVDAPGADRRLFDFDQPHSLNAAISWKHGRWQLGGRFQLYSGLPYTPPMASVFDSDRNLYVPVYGKVNSNRAPMHHQLDLRVDYSWRWGPTDLTVFLDVQNVYMNESVVTYFYSYDYTQRDAFKSLPIIPSLGLRGVL
ncbi:MAG TPA: TonB-dependent receptor plug domain-containing protein [Kofleriaceae bacterium]|nr:TonB-dependent receptor plug domain-containing protein [Kofleriaceae bacterium]